MSQLSAAAAEAEGAHLETGQTPKMKCNVKNGLEAVTWRYEGNKCNFPRLNMFDPIILHIICVKLCNRPTVVVQYDDMLPVAALLLHQQ